MKEAIVKNKSNKHINQFSKIENPEMFATSIAESYRKVGLDAKDLDFESLGIDLGTVTNDLRIRSSYYFNFVELYSLYFMKAKKNPVRKTSCAWAEGFAASDGIHPRRIAAADAQMESRNERRCISKMGQARRRSCTFMPARYQVCSLH